MVTPNMKAAALTSYYISYVISYIYLKLLFVTAGLGHAGKNQL